MLDQNLRKTLIAIQEQSNIFTQGQIAHALMAFRNHPMLAQHVLGTNLDINQFSVESVTQDKGLCYLNLNLPDPKPFIIFVGRRFTLDNLHFTAQINQKDNDPDHFTWVFLAEEPDTELRLRLDIDPETGQPQPKITISTLTQERKTEKRHVDTTKDLRVAASGPFFRLFQQPAQTQPNASQEKPSFKPITEFVNSNKETLANLLEDTLSRIKNGATTILDKESAELKAQLEEKNQQIQAEEKEIKKRQASLAKKQKEREALEEQIANLNAQTTSLTQKIQPWSTTLKWITPYLGLIGLVGFIFYLRTVASRYQHKLSFNSDVADLFPFEAYKRKSGPMRITYCLEQSMENTSTPIFYNPNIRHSHDTQFTYFANSPSQYYVQGINEIGRQAIRNGLNYLSDSSKGGLFFHENCGASKLLEFFEFVNSTALEIYDKRYSSSIPFIRRSIKIDSREFPFKHVILFANSVFSDENTMCKEEKFQQPACGTLFTLLAATESLGINTYRGSFAGDIPTVFIDQGELRNIISKSNNNPLSSSLSPENITKNIAENRYPWDSAALQELTGYKNLAPVERFALWTEALCQNHYGQLAIASLVSFAAVLLSRKVVETYRTSNKHNKVAKFCDKQNNLATHALNVILLASSSLIFVSATKVSFAVISYSVIAIAGHYTFGTGLLSLDSNTTQEKPSRKKSSRKVKKNSKNKEKSKNKGNSSPSNQEDISLLNENSAQIAQSKILCAANITFFLIAWLELEPPLEIYPLLFLGIGLSTKLATNITSGQIIEHALGLKKTH